MELEEAKKVLLIIQDKINWELQFKENDIRLQGCINAIDTVLQELDRLQKENEKLKEIDLTTVHIKGVCDEKERWRTKIRELIEELNKLLPDIDYRDIKDKQEREYYKKEYHKVVAQINVLENLLKEE